jgi:hypothetical protein
MEYAFLTNAAATDGSEGGVGFVNRGVELSD